MYALLTTHAALATGFGFRDVVCVDLFKVEINVSDFFFVVERADVAVEVAGFFVPVANGFCAGAAQESPVCRNTVDVPAAAEVDWFPASNAELPRDQAHPNTQTMKAMAAMAMRKAVWVALRPLTPGQAGVPARRRRYRHPA